MTAAHESKTSSNGKHRSTLKMKVKLQIFCQLFDNPTFIKSQLGTTNFVMMSDMNFQSICLITFKCFTPILPSGISSGQESVHDFNRATDLASWNTPLGPAQQIRCNVSRLSSANLILGNKNKNCWYQIFERSARTNF